ncbi:MAG: hypothetical protein IH851_00725 [Armatimonadetes bacterium]|nr:hypothetical protein [Armatimonadota bacterium]
MDEIVHLPQLVRELYKTVAELERMFPGRRFTPDGHMVGSIGEVLAAHRYGLKLLSASSPKHDAVSPSSIKVQIKATQIDRVALSSEPDHLLVLQLHRDGTFQEIFNGPGHIAWKQVGKLQKNGQCAIGVSKLRRLMETVPENSQLKPVTPRAGSE